MRIEYFYNNIFLRVTYMWIQVAIYSNGSIHEALLFTGELTNDATL